jgi:tetratricopeptide (TPR) repeat protein
MSITDVIASAERAMQRADYQAAIPALQEVISRTAPLTDPQGKQTAQTCRFELARIYYQMGDISTGMALVEEYLNNDPRPQERLALRMLAQGFFDVRDWDKIIELAQRLLKFTDLDRDDLFNVNLLLGQAYFQKQEWANCIQPLRFAETNAKDDRTKGICQIMVTRALVETEQWNELYSWILRVYRTDRRYNISINLTIMKAGQSRYEDEDYLNALYLYRMVLPRGDLLQFANKRVAELKKQISAANSEVENKVVQNDVDEVEQSIKTLNELPPYEEEVTFRIGQIYADVKRYWEGYVLFDKLYRTDRNSEIGEAAMLQSVLVLYELNKIDRAEERVLQYLEEKPDGKYARTMLSMMVRNRLVRNEFDKVIELRGQIETLPASDDPAERQMQADLHYMLAFGYLQSGEYKLAGEQFDTILSKLPEGQQVPEALFYRGMSFMLQADYANALADFKTYQSKHEYGDLYPSSVFREGVCLYGLERIKESEEVFTRFIDDFPSDPLVSEAYSLRGDIEAAKEGDPEALDRAQSDYLQAIDTATMPLQASYPAFQGAKTYQLEAKWDKIIELMNIYMNRHEEWVDVAEAVYWTGQAQLKLGHLQDKAIPAYITAIERFGNDPAQMGVDKIIFELVNIADKQLTPEARNNLVIDIRVKLAASDEGLQVLRLRLQLALALLEGKEATDALGRRLMDTVEDLSIAPPGILAMMCDAAVDAGNVEQMKRLSAYYIGHFDDSEQLWKAYRAKTVALQAEKNHSAVLATIEEAQGVFGADAFMGWAQLAKADTLYATDRFIEAEEAYNGILGIPQWRGPLYAEANYGIGRSRLAKGDVKGAHAFFQRTYLLFKAYADGDWAAKGYLAAADCLIKLNDKEGAINTLKAMLDDEYTNTNPLAEQAREQLKTLGGI